MICGIGDCILPIHRMGRSRDQVGVIETDTLRKEQFGQPLRQCGGLYKPKVHKMKKPLCVPQMGADGAWVSR